MQTKLSDDVRRSEAWRKVTGSAEYCDDMAAPAQYVGRILTSPHARAIIEAIHIDQALSYPGVIAVITGHGQGKTGALLEDRPPLAIGEVRYAGEPVAIAVAVDEAAANAALSLIQVDYTALPAVLNIEQALAINAPLVHKNPSSYVRAAQDIYPQDGANIASAYRIRKGDARGTLSNCDVTVKGRFSMPPTDHLAMEVRTAHASISPDGEVEIVTCSQSPYTVQEQVAKHFGFPAGKVRVRVPLIGGAFGGKAPVMLEYLAVMASQAVGGHSVRMVITREQDTASAPCRMGFTADIVLGATHTGMIQAAEMTYWLDCGAYCDSAPYMSKAVAADCTGPYRVDHLSCDSYCVYTNHTYVTSFRGFGHESYTFCIERALDLLADRLGIDPWQLRWMNALKPGDSTPTRVVATQNNLGDVPACLDKLKTLCNWEEGIRIQLDDRTVRAKGIACLWKAATPPTNAPSGAFIAFNGDGSLNLNIGVVEMGNGAQHRLAQMLAAKFRMDVGMVHVNLEIDTRVQPRHWKTVASLSAFLAGHAVMRAADDAIAQIKQVASQALDCQPEDVEIAGAKAFTKSDPAKFFHLKELVQGYLTPDQRSVGQPVLGRGSYMLKGLSMLNPQTGKGQTGPSWTVGAQAVEVELDTVDYTYRILNASTVMDVGALVGPQSTAGMIMGGMSMGISLSSRESFVYDGSGIMLTPNLRSYKLLHIGQEPDYRIGFVTTPQEDAPCGARSFSEHGIIGIPAALGNALSRALGKEINTLPITPETLWKAAGGKHDRQ